MASAVAFFRNAMGSAQVPFAGTPLHGLQVLGFLETRNLQFDRVFLLDANDDVLPGGREYDVVLTPRVRETLGLPTHRDHEQIVDYYFTALLSGAREVHLFFVENDRKERSRFVERLLWVQQRRAGTADLTDAVSTIQYNASLENTEPAPIPKSDDVLTLLSRFTFTASALDTYLRCPIRFYYAYLLRLEEKEELTDEIESSDVGVFVHSILAEYFYGRRGRPLQKDDIDPAAMDATVDAVFARTYGVSPVGQAFLVRNQIRQRMREFLEYYQQPLLEKEVVTITGLEGRLSAEKDAVSFKGFVDRVELRGDRVFILDYKTGHSETHARINRSKLVVDDRASWSDAIYLSSDPDFNPQVAQRVGEFGSPMALAPSEGYAQEQSIVLPHEMLGLRYVFVVTDFRNQVLESDETDNCTASDASTYARPDLQLTALGAPASGVAGSTATGNVLTVTAGGVVGGVNGGAPGPR
jgi:hypothetical protein